MDFFSIRKMLGMLEEYFPPNLFLVQNFFNNTPDISDSSVVEIDIERRGRLLAPFVSPVLEGKVVRGEGYTTRTYKPPYLKPKTVTKAANMLTRQAGENPYSQMSLVDRANAKLAKDLQELTDQVWRRVEWMAASLLSTGRITVAGEGVDEVLDFQVDATHRYTPATVWSAGGADILGDIELMGERIAKDTGLIMDKLLVSADVLNVLLKNSEVRELLDNRRISIGNISAGPAFQGAKFHGVINDVEIWSYKNWHQDVRGGALIPTWPDGLAVGVASDMRTEMMFGAIQDLDAVGVVSPYFAKSWREEDPSAQNLLVQSAPLPAIIQIDGFVIGSVL